jgi:transcriptional regulator with XRE-family HTH domain
MSSSPQFDVFLSHNSKDKLAARLLAEALKKRGLRVWLDEWELMPGRPGQEALEEIIRTVQSAAVLVGKDGLGPWEQPEMRACLGEFVRRQLRVIPVLLPDAAKPNLPLFLRDFTWVDLSCGLKEGLYGLEWGITGVKPRRYKTNGEMAKECRLRKGWTLWDLKNKSGVKTRTLGQIENGNGASPTRLKWVAQALGIGDWTNLLANPKDSASKISVRSTSWLRILSSRTMTWSDAFITPRARACRQLSPTRTS